MPRRPSWPISPTASAGKRCARSHSAANGFSRSSAKLRAMSRMMACSCESIMAPSLPWDRAAVVIVEAAAVVLAEIGDDAAQASHALLGIEQRTAPAHIGAHPAGMEQRGDHLGMAERERAPHRIERRLGRAIGVEAAIAVGAHRAQAAGDGDHLALLAARHLRMERAGE